MKYMEHTKNCESNKTYRALFHGGRPFNLDPLTLLLMNSLSNFLHRLQLDLNLFELIQTNLRGLVYSLFELKIHSTADAYLQVKNVEHK